MSTKYSHAYFRKSLPEWKRKKDSFLVRYFFRPISFYTASFAANRGIGANDVSYFSMLIAIIGSVLYLLDNRVTYIIGALLIIFWMVLDCTDGNLARSVKQEPFGEFADGASSYILINFLFAALGVAAYKSEGILLSSGTWWIVLLGAFGGGSDSLARLLFQKFENNKNSEMIKHIDDSSIATDNKKGNLVKIHDRIDKELGLNGIFLPALLICSIFLWFDIFVLFYGIFYILTLFATAVLLIKRAYKAKEEL